MKRNPPKASNPLIALLWSTIYRPLLRLLLRYIGYPLGAILVVSFSLGFVLPGSDLKLRDPAFLSGNQSGWFHLFEESDGRRVIPAETVALIGWIAFVLTCMAGVIFLNGK